MSTPIRLDGGDAHFGHDFDYAFGRGFDISFDRIAIGDVGQLLFGDHVGQAFISHIGIDRLSAVADEQAEVMHFAGFTCFEGNPDFGALAFSDEVVVKTTHGQERGDGRAVFVDIAI